MQKRIKGWQRATPGTKSASISLLRRLPLADQRGGYERLTMFGVELYGNRTPNKREQRVIELVARELKKLRSRRRSRHGRALRQELPSRQLRQARAVEP